MSNLISFNVSPPDLASFQFPRRVVSRADMIFRGMGG